MPNDTNTLGNLMGGNLLNWMDIAAAISAQRHCRRVCVTAAVNNVSFERPIRLADVVIIDAQVTRAFTSSMDCTCSDDIVDYQYPLICHGRSD